MKFLRFLNIRFIYFFWFFLVFVILLSIKNFLNEELMLFLGSFLFFGFFFKMLYFNIQEFFISNLEEIYNSFLNIYNNKEKRLKNFLIFGKSLIFAYYFYFEFFINFFIYLIFYPFSIFLKNYFFIFINLKKVITLQEILIKVSIKKTLTLIFLKNNINNFIFQNIQKNFVLYLNMFDFELNNLQNLNLFANEMKKKVINEDMGQQIIDDNGDIWYTGIEVPIKEFTIYAGVKIPSNLKKLSKKELFELTSELSAKIYKIRVAFKQLNYLFQKYSRMLIDDTLSSDEKLLKVSRLKIIKKKLSYLNKYYGNIKQIEIDFKRPYNEGVLDAECDSDPESVRLMLYGLGLTKERFLEIFGHLTKEGFKDQKAAFLALRQQQIRDSLLGREKDKHLMYLIRMYLTMMGHFDVIDDLDKKEGDDNLDKKEGDDNLDKKEGDDNLDKKKEGGDNLYKKEEEDSLDRKKKVLFKDYDYDIDEFFDIKIEFPFRDVNVAIEGMTENEFLYELGVGKENLLNFLGMTKDEFLKGIGITKKGYISMIQRSKKIERNKIKKQELVLKKKKKDGWKK